jgi:hypothetical protein
MSRSTVPTRLRPPARAARPATRLRRFTGRGSGIMCAVINPKPLGRIVLLVVAVTTALAACSSASASKPGAVSAANTAPAPTTRTHQLHGSYVQPALKISDLKPIPGGTKESFRADGGTIWHGDLEGRTAFVMHGVVDTKTHATSGTNTEVFTGSMAGVGRGHIHFLETFTSDAKGTLSLDATITGSDDALIGLSGTMHFAGPSNPTTGAGYGTYAATFTSH